MQTSTPGKRHRAVIIATPNGSIEAAKRQIVNPARRQGLRLFIADKFCYRLRTQTLTRGSAIRWNPIHHPVLYEVPHHGINSPWEEHVPAARLVVDLARPARLVEVGGDDCVSYFTFCDAVQRLGLPTRCTCIGTWRPMREGEPWGAERLLGARLRHDALYRAFSEILPSRRPFDEVASGFENGSIDVLHFTAQAAREASPGLFSAWLPKLTDKGVVLFSGLLEKPAEAIREGWLALRRHAPGLELDHAQGFAMAAVGRRCPEAFLDFLAISGEEEAEVYRQFFQRLGRRARETAERRIRADRAHLRSQAAEQESGCQRKEIEKLNAALVRKDGELGQLDGELSRVNAELARVNTELTRVNGELTRVNRELTRVDAELGRVSGDLAGAESALRTRQTDLAVRERELQYAYYRLSCVHQSASWKLGRLLVVPAAWLYSLFARALRFSGTRESV